MALRINHKYFIGRTVTMEDRELFIKGKQYITNNIGLLIDEEGNSHDNPYIEKEVYEKERFKEW